MIDAFAYLAEGFRNLQSSDRRRIKFANILRGIFFCTTLEIQFSDIDRMSYHHHPPGGGEAA
jgi:hypothetical protein